MIRISQKSLNIENLDELYSSLEEESITIRRIFDPRYSHSGDDLIIEGEIDKVLGKLSQDLPRIISIRFLKEDYGEILEPKSALNIKHENKRIFFGTTLVDYNNLFDKLRIKEKTQILSLLFRSQLGGHFISLMPVKIKGIVVTNIGNSSIEFILPTQRIETLKTWLHTLSTKQSVDFDTLVDIYRDTDPSMRKQMEEAMNWVNLQLPELVAKSTNIEGIDVVRAYQSSLALM
jgi:hypothetical protein